ncbi:MAG TPA: ATP-binding protein [Terriglobia bacterium]|nr:ATP-binding protein [Terriglobia bacterium]
MVRHRIQLQVREQIRQALQSSVATFQQFQQQREATLERSSALLAGLPTLEALMTSQDQPTIQDGSLGLWKTIDSDLFVLADRSGKLVALQTVTPEFARVQARDSLQRSLARGETRDWWFGGGHLFQVFIHPIYFGAPSNGTELGVLVLGYEINGAVAADVRRVASSQVAFRCGPTVVVSTLSAAQNEDLMRQALLGSATPDTPPVDIDLGRERFLATSTDVASGSWVNVSLVVLKSYDQATAFLQSLNRWLLGLGLTAILAGSLLVVVISDTFFTRPLASLLGGVNALERGDFDYPLEPRGNDEISDLTRSFDRMRRTLQTTQHDLLQAERLATIGRMASTVSHDLRHSLSAILAYAEFLSEGRLGEGRRTEFYQEIRQAVNQMTEQLRALLEFSKPKMVDRPVRANLEEVIERALRTVKARPEFSGVRVITSFNGGHEGLFDPANLERVFHNLLLNACEAVPPDSGVIEVTIGQTSAGLEVRIADNGGGIPAEIRERLFQPFVTAGKDNGIGLGLAVVQKIVQEHGGQVNVERTGPSGTVLRVTLPGVASQNPVASPGPA